MSREVDKPKRKRGVKRKTITPIQKLQEAVVNGDATASDLATALEAKGLLKEQPPVPVPIVESPPPEVEVKKAQRFRNISWWKIIPGVALVALGILAVPFYFADRNNYFAVGIMMGAFAGGGFLIYTGFTGVKAGVLFSSNNGKKVTGKENAIVIYARRDTATNKDVPYKIEFEEVDHVPEGATLHRLRNDNKHYYELMNVTTAASKKLVPVTLPDKRAFPPELFRIPATMQPYKDYMDYSPPTLLEKVAPAVLLGAIFLVGILMVMTISPGGS